MDKVTPKRACKAGDRIQFVTSDGRTVTGVAATPLSGGEALAVRDKAGVIRVFSGSAPVGQSVQRTVRRIRPPQGTAIALSAWQLLFFDDGDEEYYLTDDYQTDAIAPIDKDFTDAVLPVVTGFYLDAVTGDSLIAVFGYDQTQQIKVFLNGELEEQFSPPANNYFVQESFLTIGLPDGDKTMLLLPQSAAPYSDIGYTVQSSDLDGFNGRAVFLGRGYINDGFTLETPYNQCGVTDYTIQTGYVEFGDTDVETAAQFALVTAFTPTSYSTTETVIEVKSEANREETKTTSVAMGRDYAYSASGRFDWIYYRPISENIYSGSLSCSLTLTTNVETVREITGTTLIPVIELDGTGSYTRSEIEITTTFDSTETLTENCEVNVLTTYSNPSNQPTRTGSRDGNATIQYSLVSSFSISPVDYGINLGDGVEERLIFDCSGSINCTTTLISSAVNTSYDGSPDSDYNIQQWLEEGASGGNSTAGTYTGSLSWELKIPYLFFATPNTNTPLYLYTHRKRTGEIITSISNLSVARLFVSWSESESCTGYSGASWRDGTSFTGSTTVGFPLGWASDDNRGGYIFPALLPLSDFDIFARIHHGSTSDESRPDNVWTLRGRTTIINDDAVLKFGETELDDPQSYWVISAPLLDDITVTDETITVTRNDDTGRYFGVLSYRGWEPLEVATTVDEVSTKTAGTTFPVPSAAYNSSPNPITDDFMSLDWVIVIQDGEVYILYECELTSFELAVNGGNAPSYYSEFVSSGKHRTLSMDLMSFSIVSQTQIDYFPIAGSYDSAFYQGTGEPVLITTKNMLAYVCALNKHATFLDEDGEQIAVTLGQKEETERFAAIFNFDPSTASMEFEEVVSYDVDSDYGIEYAIASQKVRLDS